MNRTHARRNRRKRRATRAVLKHGREAAPIHKSRRGRTGDKRKRFG